MRILRQFSATAIEFIDNSLLAVLNTRDYVSFDIWDVEKDCAYLHYTDHVHCTIADALAVIEPCTIAVFVSGDEIIGLNYESGTVMYWIDITDVCVNVMVYDHMTNELYAGDDDHSIKVYHAVSGTVLRSKSICAGDVWGLAIMRQQESKY